MLASISEEQSWAATSNGAISELNIGMAWHQHQSLYLTKRCLLAAARGMKARERKISNNTGESWQQSAAIYQLAGVIGLWRILAAAAAINVAADISS